MVQSLTFYAFFSVFECFMFIRTSQKFLKNSRLPVEVLSLSLFFVD